MPEPIFTANVLLGTLKANGVEGGLRTANPTSPAAPNSQGAQRYQESSSNQGAAASRDNPEGPFAKAMTQAMQKSQSAPDQGGTRPADSHDDNNDRRTDSAATENAANTDLGRTTRWQPALPVQLAVTTSSDPATTSDQALPPVADALKASLGADRLLAQFIPQIKDKSANTAVSPADNPAALAVDNAPIPTATESELASPTVNVALIALLSKTSDAVKKADPIVAASNTPRLPTTDAQEDQPDPIILALPLIPSMQSAVLAPLGDNKGSETQGRENQGASAGVLPQILSSASQAAVDKSANPAGTPALGPDLSAGSTDANKFDVLLQAANQLATSSGIVNNGLLSTAAPSSTTASLPVVTPVGGAGWDREIADKLTWMSGNNQAKAELVLNPPQMGRIEVTVDLKGSDASVQFVSANPVVRESLQQALPHLKEIMQSAGINLGQTHVGAESFSQQAQGFNNGAQQRQERDPTAAAFALLPPADSGKMNKPDMTRWLHQGNGLVDAFA